MVDYWDGETKRCHSRWHPTINGKWWAMVGQCASQRQTLEMQVQNYRRTIILSMLNQVIQCYGATQSLTYDKEE